MDYNQYFSDYRTIGLKKGAKQDTRVNEFMILYV